MSHQLERAEKQMQEGHGVMSAAQQGSLPVGSVPQAAEGWDGMLPRADLMDAVDAGRWHKTMQQSLATTSAHPGWPAAGIRGPPAASRCLTI